MYRNGIEYTATREEEMKGIVFGGYSRIHRNHTQSHAQNRVVNFVVSPENLLVERRSFMNTRCAST